MLLLEDRLPDAQIPEHYFASAEREDYDTLRDRTLQLGRDIGVPARLFGITVRLIDELAEFDQQSAQDSLEAVDYAMSTNAVMETVGVGVSPVDVWAGTVTHDVGKRAVLPWVINDGNAGIWSAEHMRWMQRHIYATQDILQAAGVDRQIVYAAREHHSMQGPDSYSINVDELSAYERMLCRTVVIGDYTSAMLKRTNTRNATMSYQERRQDVADRIRGIFDDSPNLADVIAMCLVDTVPNSHEFPEAV